MRIEIKDAISCFKKPLRAQDFGTQYHPDMDGTDRFILCPACLYWATFISTIKSQFLSSFEGQEAKKQIDSEKYSGDIED
jgi:hypothetical protein